MKKFIDGIVEFMGMGNPKRIESIKTTLKDIENKYVDAIELKGKIILNLDEQIETYKGMVESRDTHIEALNEHIEFRDNNIKILNDHIASQNKAIVMLKFNLESK